MPLVRVPLAVVHGTADPFIPAADADALYDAAPEPRRLRLVTGMGHAFEPPAIEPIVESVAWSVDPRT